MEECLKKIISDRLLEINDPKVASFIFTANEAMIKRVKKADINDLLKKFGCGDGDIISEHLANINLQPYFDVITNRHRVSHDQGASMTLDDFGKALPCGEAILLKVMEVLAND